MCLAQRPQRSDVVRLKPGAPRSRVKHFTTEPLPSLIVIKWKERYDAVVVDCHHCGDRMKMSPEANKSLHILLPLHGRRNTMQWLRLSGDRMKMSLPKKKKSFFFFFLRETSTSLWVPFWAKFQPLGRLFRPSCPLAYSQIKEISIHGLSEAMINNYLLADNSNKMSGNIAHNLSMPF